MMVHKIPIETRFLLKVRKTDTCWLWTGARCDDGYGHFNIGGHQRRAHRVAWELWRHEPIPDGLMVLHHCDVPLCVNPDHLFLGTHKDNFIDWLNKGGTRCREIYLRGEAHPRHKVTANQVLEIRTSRKSCKELARIFGLSDGQVSKIRNGTSWKSLKATVVITMILLLPLALMLLTAASEAAPITLTWSSPGDDGNVGTASQYDLRYATAPLIGTDTTAYWSGMTQVTGEPVPLIAGTTQSWSGDLPVGTYYWLIRTADEVPNWSGFSNIAVKVVSDQSPPSRIMDLR